MKKFTAIIFSLLLIIATSSAFAMDGGGGGGGPSFSNGMPGSSSTCGTTTLSNSSASVNSACDPVDISNCPAGKNESIDYGDCRYTTNGGGLCSVETCTCIGSMENNIFSTFCAPATGQFDFEIGAISCSGGAASLQFVVWSNTSSSSICDMENDVEFCDNGFTSNTTFSVNLTAGTCYTLMFDGNAGADCTWDFTINCSYALGLTMLDYSVTLSNDEKNVNMSWDVTDEVDVNYYSIERSTDDENYSSIGKIFAHNNTSKSTSYDFIDENPVMGISYYRLMEIDNNGIEYKYGKHVINKTTQDLSIYPNPISDDLNISFGNFLNEGAKIMVYDVLGNLVYDRELAERKSSIKIDMNDAKKGMYFLVIKSKDGDLQQKFYKD